MVALSFIVDLEVNTFLAIVLHSVVEKTGVLQAFVLSQHILWCSH